MMVSPPLPVLSRHSVRIRLSASVELRIRHRRSPHRYPVTLAVPQQSCIASWSAPERCSSRQGSGKSRKPRAAPAKTARIGNSPFESAGVPEPVAHNVGKYPAERGRPRALRRNLLPLAGSTRTARLFFMTVNPALLQPYRPWWRRARPGVLASRSSYRGRFDARFLRLVRRRSAQR